MTTSSSNKFFKYVKFLIIKQDKFTLVKKQGFHFQMVPFEGPELTHSQRHIAAIATYGIFSSGKKTKPTEWLLYIGQMRINPHWSREEMLRHSLTINPPPNWGRELQELTAPSFSLRSGVWTPPLAPQFLKPAPERQAPKTSDFESQWGLCPQNPHIYSKLRNMKGLMSSLVDGHHLCVLYLPHSSSPVSPRKELIYSSATHFV